MNNNNNLIDTADLVAGFPSPVTVQIPAAAAQTVQQETAVTAQAAAPELTKEEKKAIKKAKRKDFNINAALVGIMMIIFALIMNFAGVYINEIAMYVAIPDVVTAVYNEGGLAAVDNFYYYEYCAEGGEYFALSGITDNIGYCFFVLAYFIPFAIFAINRKLRGKIFGPGTGFSANFLFYGCVIGMGLLYIWAYAYQYAAEYITSFDLGYIFTLFDTSSNAAMATPLGTIFYLLGTCVFAPIGEEFVCRGVILGTLRKYGNWWAIFMTAALFGLMHMNFYQGPYALLIGMVLGFVTVKTGSIWCAVLIHMINNTWSCLSEVVAEYLPMFDNLFYGLMVLVVIAFIPASVIMLIIFAAKGQLKLPKTDEAPGTKLRCKTLRFSISPLNFIYIAFCLLNCILLILPGNR